MVTAPKRSRPLSREVTDEKLKNARLLDDTYMSVFFSQEKECVKAVLDVILDKDLQIVRAVTQQVWINPGRRSVKLDVFATDSDGKQYNIELQRRKDEAHPYRARYHGSSIDTHTTPPGTGWEELPEVYIIFITETDVLAGGLPVYTVETVIRENQQPIDIGLNICYINTSARHTGDGLSRQQTAMNDLIDDLLCRDPSDMHSKVLSERAHYLKNTEKGRSIMYETFNDVYAEGYEKGEAKGIIETIRDLGLTQQAAISQLHKRIPDITEAAAAGLVQQYWNTAN